MKASDLVGKYATLCCYEDMLLISDEIIAQDCINWNLEIGEECPSMMYQFADSLEQATVKWSINHKRTTHNNI